MDVERLFEVIGSEFYAGVPDSQLRGLCDFLMDRYGTDPRHHAIAANEGSCVALAAGYHLATGKIPAVYMQNSGEGNAINPMASLLHGKVYAIPCVFLVGWRGEPGIQDEPQHAFQGEVTLRLLEDMDICTFVLGKGTTEGEAARAMAAFREGLALGKSAAFVIRRGALHYKGRPAYRNGGRVTREGAIQHVVRASGKDPVIATTGKASRELFEIREAAGQGHQRDFLTVGSMGHCSSIALGIALNKPGAKVWCIDGDGAALMHLGSLAVIGAAAPQNMVHVIINNGAHETVGGMPTAAARISLADVAAACGYPHAVCVDGYADLDRELGAARGRDALSLIEVRCSIGSRAGLGRPTVPAIENKERFMEYLSGL